MLPLGLIGPRLHAAPYVVVAHGAEITVPRKAAGTRAARPPRAARRGGGRRRGRRIRPRRRSDVAGRALRGRRRSRPASTANGSARSTPTHAREPRAHASASIPTVRSCSGSRGSCPRKGFDVVIDAVRRSSTACSSRSAAAGRDRAPPGTARAAGAMCTSSVGSPTPTCRRVRVRRRVRDVLSRAVGRARGRGLRHRVPRGGRVRRARGRGPQRRRARGGRRRRDRIRRRAARRRRGPRRARRALRRRRLRRADGRGGPAAGGATSSRTTASSTRLGSVARGDSLGGRTPRAGRFGSRDRDGRSSSPRGRRSACSRSSRSPTRSGLHALDDAGRRRQRSRCSSSSLPIWIYAFGLVLVRSTRGDDIAVASWVFLTGSAPPDVRRHSARRTAASVVIGARDRVGEPVRRARADAAARLLPRCGARATASTRPGGRAVAAVAKGARR